MKKSKGYRYQPMGGAMIVHGFVILDDRDIPAARIELPWINSDADYKKGVKIAAAVTRLMEKERPTHD